MPHNHAGSWVCSLNYPLTARWLKPAMPSRSWPTNKQSELPPHREVIDPNPRYPKKISGIFLCKKLKKLACPGIDSERKSSWENLRKKFPKKLKKPARPGIYSERRWSHDKELLRCSHVPLIFRHSFFKGVFTWTDIFSPLFRRSFMTCGSAIFIPRLPASLTAPLIITNKT